MAATGITDRKKARSALVSALDMAKTPPHALDLEKAVLGAMMLERTALYDVQGILTTQSFFDPAHQHIFDAIQAVFQRDQPADILMVTQELSRVKKLDEVGGAFYISQLTNKVASSANVQYHARIIQQKHVLREIIEAAASAQSGAYDDGDPFEVLGQLTAKLNGLELSYDSDKITMGSEHLAKLSDTDSSNKATFRTIGIPQLDEFAALYRGRTHLVAARPGVGKSIVMIESAWHCTLDGPVMIFSLEMPADECVARIMALESGIPYGTIYKQKMTEQQLDLFHKTAARIGDRLHERLIIDETEGISWPVMRTRLEQYHRKYRLEAFFVDYVQLMTTGDRKVDNDSSPLGRVSKCSNALRAMAKSLDLPGMILSQFSREIEKRPDPRPKISDLRESGELEQDASVIFLMWRPNYGIPNPPYDDVLHIHCGKHRGGALRTVQVPITPAENRLNKVPLPTLTGEVPRDTSTSQGSDDPAPF